MNLVEQSAIASKVASLGSRDFGRQLWYNRNHPEPKLIRYSLQPEQVKTIASIKSKEVYAKDIKEMDGFIKRYEILAQKGNVLAMDRLGQIYLENHLIRNDLRKAESYLSQSAKGGFPDAQLRLAMMHISRKAAKPSFEVAIYWLDQAARNGNISAGKILNNLQRVGLSTNPDQRIAALAE